MFTGIIQSVGAIKQATPIGTDIQLAIATHQLDMSDVQLGDSIAVNGVCLTVTAVDDHTHRVTAIDETLRRTNLGSWQPGTHVNLERCLPMGGRLDGHMVQGHVDDTGICTGVVETGGSWRFTFRYRPTPEHLLVDKGSVCINGVSLTVVDPLADTFSVAIIPYTWEHTNFKILQLGDAVNLEFDIIGKYIARHLAAYGAKH